MEMLLELWEQFLPVLLAAIAGGLIGIEREYRDKSAGFRTMMLVAVGSCLFTLLAVSIGGPEKETTRILAAVVTGIGFMGAGAVLKDGLNIKGLTTAASIWLVASLGMAAGAEEYALMFAVTIFSLIVLWALPPFEHWLDRLHEFMEITITIKNSDEAEDDILDIFDEIGIKVVHLSRSREEKGERILHVLVKMNPAKRKELSEILVNEKGILKFSA